MISIVNRTAFTLSSASSPQSVTIPATTAGNTVVIMCFAGTGTQSPSSAKLGSTIMGDPWGRWRSGTFVSENVVGGQTTVTFGYQGSGILIPGAGVIYELTPCSYANGGSGGSANVTPGTSEAGVTLTQASNSVYFEVISQDTAGSYNSVSSPWVFDYSISPIPQAGADMGSVVYILNTTGSQTPTWNVTNGGAHCGVAAIALQDSVITLVQLINGGYQDFLGNPLAKGYLMMNISNPVEIYTVGNDVIEGNDIKFKISLDNNGNVSTTPAQYVFIDKLPDAYLPVRRSGICRRWHNRKRSADCDSTEYGGPIQYGPLGSKLAFI